MRVLSIGNFGHGWDGSICDEEHIAKTLQELGHTVVCWQRDDPNLKHAGTVPWFDDDGDPDFTLIAQWDHYTDEFLEGLPHPLVYWAFDYQADGQEWHERLIKRADLYLSKRIADSKYSNWQWFSQDFAPTFLKPPKVWPEPDIDALFTGSYLPWATERNEIIKAVNEKFNLAVHSVNDWPFLQRRAPIMDQGLPELYARAKVILSIDHTIEAGYWSDRNAQIIACGKRPLFRYVPLSESRFKHDVDYFYNTQDCLEKVQSILDGPNVWAMADNRQDYLVAERVGELLTIVKSIL